MRRLALSLIGLALIAAGCGSSEEKTAAACFGGAAAFSRALTRAPAAVELEGETPISACLTPNQSAGDITRLGKALLGSTTTLNAQARGNGGESAARRLGYLIGAVQRGAEDTGGIHTNLVARLEAAAEFSPGGAPIPATIRTAYVGGVAAGHSSG